MSTQNNIQPNWWNFPPLFSREAEPPLETLVDIYSEQSLGTLMQAMWHFFDATHHLKDDDLNASRSDIMYYYTLFTRLILATWQMAQETNRVPKFKHDQFSRSRP